MPNVFRWNISRREQLGRLPLDEPDFGYYSFERVLPELRRCSARVLAMAGDSRLVFIGRSPESLYDYLTGALSGTSWADRSSILNLSLKTRGGVWDTMDAAARSAMCEQFRTVGVDPASIASSPKPTTFIDLIYAGETFEKLVQLLLAWAGEVGIDDRLMRRRVRIIGITERDETGAKGPRWKRTKWAAHFQPRDLKGVAVPGWFWGFLGDYQKKVSRSNPPSRWGDPEMARPPRESEHREALRGALAIHNAGRTRVERDALAAELSQQPSVRHVWCRVLAAELRAASRRKRVERSFGSKQHVRSWRRHVDQRSSSSRY
jgi:hypothetical protein